MKTLKFILLGSLLFATPILFYLQALEQQKQKDEEIKNQKNADATYLALYRSFIKDSIQLSLISKNNSNEIVDIQNSLKKVSDLIDSLQKKTPNINSPKQVYFDTAFRKIIQGLNELKDSLISERNKKSFSPDAAGVYYFPHGVTIRYNDTTPITTITIDKKNILKYKALCIHLQISHEFENTMFFQFPNNNDIEYTAYLCRAKTESSFSGFVIQHEKDNKIVPEVDIPKEFHTEIKNNLNPKNREKLLYAVYFALSSNTTNINLNMRILDSGDKYVNPADKQLNIKFQ